MNKEIKERWVAELRSGDYLQGTDNLKYDCNGETRYCCLGVLTELYAQEHGIKFTGDEDELKYENGELLCEAVQIWAGLESHDPVVSFIHLRGSASTNNVKGLSSINDDGYSFAEIADTIEELL